MFPFCTPEIKCATFCHFCYNWLHSQAPVCLLLSNYYFVGKGAHKSWTLKTGTLGRLTSSKVASRYELAGLDWEVLLITSAKLALYFQTLKRNKQRVWSGGRTATSAGRWRINTIGSFSRSYWKLGI